MSDLNLARLSQPDGVLLEDLCFHAQQAAEKALKAVLVANSVAVPNIHSIRRLIDLLPANPDLPEEVQNAAGSYGLRCFEPLPG
ncbi:MAG: HEPN domain-containing protein [Candidatus Marinimicrobia bacterium]|nr:HEPN domain-containing protein [Candidatus Neomarinimicrobiota bacterium]